jgi:hypothetical protein
MKFQMGSTQPVIGRTVHSKHSQATTAKNGDPTNSSAAARPGTAAMDYTLAALKVFGSHLADSTNAPSSEGTSSAHMLFGVRY